MESRPKCEKQNFKTFRTKFLLWGWERSLKQKEKHKPQRKRLINLITWKLNIFVYQRHPKVQRQITNWERTFAMHKPGKGLISRKYKEHLQISQIKVIK